MMYPRLALLRDFLTEDGVVFISIDDNEVQNLRAIMDEIFGEENFIATVIWHKMDSPKNSAVHLSEDHDYILLYARNAQVWRPNPLPRTEEMNKRYKNPDGDPRGPWLLSDLAARNFYAAGRYSITTPSGRVIDGPPSGSYWRVSKEKLAELDADNRVWWGKSQSNRPGIKRFLCEVREGVVPQTLWPWREVGSTRHSKQELSSILDVGTSQDLFITPKPTRLIERIITIATGPGDFVMDSFAGSGTTAHAVLNANAQSAKNEPIDARHFILIEMEKSICDNVTAERIKRIIGGYTNSKGEAVPGLGGGFRYCELGETLFEADGAIRSSVSFSDLAHHIFFTEMREPLPEEVAGTSPLLGVGRGTAVYLLYNGILKDKNPKGGNVLTMETLRLLPPHHGPRIVYGTACTLGASTLRRHGVIFRQIPYEVKAT